MLALNRQQTGTRRRYESTVVAIGCNPLKSENKDRAFNLTAARLKALSLQQVEGK